MTETRPLAKILVVDDDVDHCLMLEVALQCLGYEVVLAHSYQDAVAILRSTALDALVCDLTLGDGTALDVLGAVGGRRPRVCIVLSGYDSDEDRDRSIAAGFDEHVVKPTSIDELGRIMRAGLQRRDSGMRPKTTPESLAQSGKKLRNG